MTRAEAWSLHAGTLLVGVSGLVYGWMRYFARPADEFAVVNHPLQPAVQETHVLAAPLLVFAVGLVWTEHVWRRLAAGHRERRKSGLVLAAALLPMVASGYLLQIAEGELARRAWISVHVASSVLWLATYALHQFQPRGGRERRERPPGAG
jgi:hypothetical protein